MSRAFPFDFHWDRRFMPLWMAGMAAILLATLPAMTFGDEPPFKPTPKQLAAIKKIQDPNTDPRDITDEERRDAAEPFRQGMKHWLDSKNKPVSKDSRKSAPKSKAPIGAQPSPDVRKSGVNPADFPGLSEAARPPESISPVGRGRGSIPALSGGPAPAVSITIPPDDQRGTLRRKGAIAWRNATAEEKLDTCVGYLTEAWQKKRFTYKLEKVSSVDDLQPYAQNMVKIMDVRLGEDESLEDQRILDQQLGVAGTAEYVMISNLWVVPKK